MAARSGMTNLISRWRRLVDDTGTVAFSDDRAQEILDGERFDFYQEPLTVQAQQVAAGSVAYHVYTSIHHNLEGTASGTVAFRLYDSLGTVITSGYTFDDQLGRFVFTANQAGSARYLDGRSYDLNGAAAAGWRERAGMQADAYDFRVEGRQYSRSQWFKHCMDMAQYYESLRSNQAQWGSWAGVIERSDMIVC